MVAGPWQSRAFKQHVGRVAGGGWAGCQLPLAATAATAAAAAAATVGIPSVVFLPLVALSGLLAVVEFLSVRAQRRSIGQG